MDDWEKQKLESKRGFKNSPQKTRSIMVIGQFMCQQYHISIRLTLRHEGFSIVNKISILVSCVLQMCLLSVNLGGLVLGGKQREEVVGLDRQWGPGRVDEYVGHLCHLYNLNNIDDLYNLDDLDDSLDDQLIITLQYYLFVSGSVSD